MIQLLFSGPLAAGCVRFFAPAIERGEFASYLLAVSMLTRRTVISSAALAVTVATTLIYLMGVHWLTIGIATGLFSITSGFSTFLDQLQNAARQRHIAAGHQALGQWLRPACALTCISLFGASATAAMAGFAAAASFTLVSQILFFKQNIATNLAKRADAATEPEVYRKAIVEYSWPFSTWGLLTWAHSSSDRWILAAFQSPREVGLYQVLYQIGYTPIAMTCNLVVVLIAPILFALVGDGSDNTRVTRSHRTVNRMVTGCLLVTSGAVLLGILAHGNLFRLLAHSSFGAVSQLLPYMILSGGLFATGQVAAISLMTRASSRALLAPKLATAAGGLILNYFAGRLYGMQGLLASNIVFGIAYLSWVYIIMRTTQAKPIDNNGVDNAVVA